MKRFSLVVLLAIFCSLPAFSQFWIHVEWGAPHCRHCEWMEEALCLSPREAAEYHRIIHKYGERIEREARKEYRYWDKAARKIFELRMERDRQLQRCLTPSQFSLYVRLMREYPQRIHDNKGWYANPKHPHLHPSHDCRRYEHDYWNYRWADMRPDNFFHGQPSHQHPGYQQRQEEKRPSYQANKGGKEHSSYKPDKRQEKRDDRFAPRSNDKKEQKGQKQSKSSKERLKVNRSEKD